LARRECRLLPAAVLVLYAALIVGGYLAPQPPELAAAIAGGDDVEIVYWDGSTLVAVRGSDTVIHWGGEWLELKGAVAEAACTWDGYLAIAASRGPYTLLARLGPDGSWASAETPGTPVALACPEGSPIAAASLGPRLAVASLEGGWLLRGVEGLLERRPGAVYVSVGAPIIVLGGGAVAWLGGGGEALAAPEGWSFAGAAETPWGAALYGSAGGDGVIAWLGGEALLVDAGASERVEAVSGGGRPVVAVVKVEGQVPALLEVLRPGSAAAHRYYPYTPMIYRGAYAGEGVAGFRETLVGLGPAAVAAGSLGYAPLGDAGVVAATSSVRVAPASWEAEAWRVDGEPLGPLPEGPPPAPGEPVELRVVEAWAERLSSAAAAAVLGAAAAAYVLRAAWEGCANA